MLVFYLCPFFILFLKLKIVYILGWSYLWVIVFLKKLKINFFWGLVCLLRVDGFFNGGFTFFSF
jgi:hypothetical protein